MSNTRLKMDKSLANFKQNPEAQFSVLVIKQQEFSLKSLPQQATPYISLKKNHSQSIHSFL